MVSAERSSLKFDDETAWNLFFAHVNGDLLCHVSLLLGTTCHVLISTLTWCVVVPRGTLTMEITGHSRVQVPLHYPPITVTSQHSKRHSVQGKNKTVQRV